MPMQVVPSPNDNFQEAEVCWICLEENSAAKPLARPCVCPRYVHPACLARWQLQSAGKREEKHCRFCDRQLPCWQATLTVAESQLGTPFMTIMHRGRIYEVPVRPGPDGFREFQQQARHICSIPDHVNINFSFGCQVPGTVDVVTLEGGQAYDAAVHCASVSAGLLAHRRPPKRSRVEGERHVELAGMAPMPGWGMNQHEQAPRMPPRHIGPRYNAVQPQPPPPPPQELRRSQRLRNARGEQM